MSTTSPAAQRADLVAAMETTMRTFMARAVLFQDAVAKSVGLNSTDLQCANLLLMQGPATPGELADRAGITAGGAITGVIDRLEQAGLASRSRDTVDRRKVVITADAEKLWLRVGGAYQRVGEEWNAYLETLTDEQVAFATQVFDRAAEVNNAEIARLRSAGRH